MKGEWQVRLTARIDDTMYVEASSEEEAIENAERDWSFVEASEWEATVIDRPEEDTDD